MPAHTHARASNLANHFTSPSSAAESLLLWLTGSPSLHRVFSTAKCSQYLLPGGKVLSLAIASRYAIRQATLYVYFRGSRECQIQRKDNEKYSLIYYARGAITSSMTLSLFKDVTGNITFELKLEDYTDGQLVNANGIEYLYINKAPFFSQLH